MAEYSETGDNEDFLKELRDNYASDECEWRPIRDEGRTDIRFVAGNPWDDADVAARREANRLYLSFDELGQYLNQTVNDILQNRRAVQVTANGNGAKDQEAELRANRIRQIEYESNAQQAYTTMFENAVQRSFGWTRITSQYTDKLRRQMKLVICAVPNPDMITPGPHVMPDGSDIKRLWYHEWRTHTEFKREFPKATVTDFSGWLDTASGWVKGDRVMVAEYWVKDDNDHVCQYFTNGVEILKKTPWPGKDIPFVPCFGKVMFVTESGKSERIIHSMVRLARGPFRAYCYVQTCIAELVAQMPKFPYFIRRGSLSDGELLLLQKSVSEPVAVIQVEAQIPETTVQTGPPEFPQRNPYDPSALQGLAMTAEAFRRTIQAAFAQSALPTQAQRHNEKSGVALKQIEDSGQKGSYHFTAHYEDAITRVGKLLNDLLPHYHDTAQDMTVRKPDDSTQQVRINDPNWVNPDTKVNPDQKPTLLAFTDGDYDVTISTGPKVDSEREAASDFGDLILQSPEFAQIIGPQKMPEILALIVKNRNIGPFGDMIAEIISPKKTDGPDPKQQIQQMQQQMQQAQQVMDAQTKQIQGLTQQIQTDQVKAQSARELQYIKNAGAVEVAKVQALSKGVVVKTEADEEAIALGLQQQHEALQNEHDRAHEVGMAAMQHQQALQQGQQAGAQDAQLSDQSHQQSLEQGAQGHEQQLEQGAQAAALAPQPEAS